MDNDLNEMFAADLWIYVLCSNIALRALVATQILLYRSGYSSETYSHELMLMVPKSRNPLNFSLVRYPMLNETKTAPT